MSNTAAESSTNEEGCLYDDVRSKFSDCLNNNYNGNNFLKVMMNVLDNDVTGVELLSQLSSTCRDERLMETYRTCTNSVTADCPQYTYIITNAVDEHVSVFCENGAPSTWLSTILENGYFNKNECTDPALRRHDVGRMILQCSYESTTDWAQLTTVPECFSALKSYDLQILCKVIV